MSLETCARCGSDKVWPEGVYRFAPDPDAYGIECLKCGQTGPRASKGNAPPDEAMDAWNAQQREIRKEGQPCP